MEANDHNKIVKNLEEILKWNEENDHRELNSYLHNLLRIVDNNIEFYFTYKRYRRYLQQIYYGLDYPLFELFDTEIDIIIIDRMKHHCSLSHIDYNLEILLKSICSLCLMCGSKIPLHCTCLLATPYCSKECQMLDWNNHKKIL
jgi:hypothetical protein